MTVRQAILGLLLGSGAAATVQAQTAAGGSPAASVALDEVVITAQRRVEKLDQVPIAASVVSGSDLADRGVVTINDLASQSPALNVQNQDFLSYVNIRGVGLQATNPTTSSGVANYSDGFFIPHETAIADAYYDVGQVEILRGPQGTLVGQSSTGGAIFVTSVRPTFDKISGYALQSFGNYGYTRTEAAINLPVSAQLAIRVAEHVDHKDSFYTNIGVADSSFNHGLEPGNLDAVGARVGVSWAPVSGLDVYLKYEYDSRKSDGFIGKDYAELAGANNAVDPRLSQPFNISYDNPTWAKYLTTRASGEINWAITDTITLRSLTGYQHSESKNLFDNDFTYQALSYANQIFREQTFEQELNLISKGPGAFSWILGAFYLHDETPTTLHLWTAPPGPPPEFLIDTQPLQRSYAFFGEGTYKFSEQWQLSVGARETRNENIQTGTQTLYNIPVPFPPFVIPQITVPLDAQVKKTIPSGKAALSYFPDPDSTIYASASRGFKAGGANAGIASNLIFDPETIDAYEGGYKASFFDRTLKVALSGFYYNYKNMQVNEFNSSGQRFIANIPKAQIYGAELELHSQVGPLLLNAGAGYTHSKIDQELILVDSGNPAAGPQDLTGRQLPYAPTWTANAGATYTVPLSIGKLMLTGQYSYTDRSYASLFELAPRDVLASHSLVNANLALVFRNGMRLEAYGTNLGNTLYAAGTIGTDQAIWGAPREYGLRIGVSL